MISKHGAPLLWQMRWIPSGQLCCRVPLGDAELAEAAALTGRAVDSVAQIAMRPRADGLGAHAALVKGGHLDGDAVTCFRRSCVARVPRAARSNDAHARYRCTYSAAVTQDWRRNGFSGGCHPRERVRDASD